MKNTNMNTGAASLSECDFVAVPRAAVEWLKEHYPALTEKAGMCERIGKRLYTKTTLATPTPQADAAPIINGHAINDLFLKWSEWTTELGEAISRKNIDGFVSELRAAIAAGGAQEAVAMSADECAQDVYEHGKSIGLFDIPKETANAICAGISAATGARVDWHYIAGRVHMKALPRVATPVAADVLATIKRLRKNPDRGDEVFRCGYNACLDTVLKVLAAPAAASNGEQ